MIMRDMPYMLTLHYIVLVMRDVRFPITKKELIDRLGDRQIRTSPDGFTAFSEILKKMPLEQYSCAAEFYSCHSTI